MAEKCERIERRTAKLLAEGKLIGCFQDRMEFGQHALGNRSILAAPRRAETKDLVNAAVTYREAFWPFAPAIFSERVSEYFEVDDGFEVPFMEKVVMFHEAARPRFLQSCTSTERAGSRHYLDSDHPQHVVQLEWRAHRVQSERRHSNVL